MLRCGLRSSFDQPPWERELALLSIRYSQTRCPSRWSRWLLPHPWSLSSIFRGGVGWPTRNERYIFNTSCYFPYLRSRRDLCHLIIRSIIFHSPSSSEMWSKCPCPRRPPRSSDCVSLTGCHGPNDWRWRKGNICPFLRFCPMLVRTASLRRVHFPSFGAIGTRHRPREKLSPNRIRHPESCNRIRHQTRALSLKDPIQT